MGLLNRTMLFEQKDITLSVFLDNISNDKPMAIPTEHRSIRDGYPYLLI
jgi:hypothetical protein